MIEQALSGMERVLAEHPQLVEAHVCKGVLLAMQGEPAAAKGAWECGLETVSDEVPGYSRLKTCLGYLECVNGEFERATKTLTESVAEDPCMSVGSVIQQAVGSLTPAGLRRNYATQLI